MHCSEELQPFSVAAEQNTRGLLKAFHESPVAGPFLRCDDIHIPLFASVLDRAEEEVKYSFDIDGVVILVSDVSCIKAELHYLFVGKLDGSKVSNHWHLLKKHLNLRQYSADGVSALHKSMGTVLALVDGGYFLNLTCVPANPDRAHPMLKDELIVKAHTMGLLNAVYKSFGNSLKTLSVEDMERPTIQKNNLNNLGKMNILKKDQTFILELFKQAILSVNDDLDMAIIVNMTKFGQKDEREFDLGCLINTEGVCNVSYHAACTVCPLDPSVDILWSRCGLQEVVGTWGTLFPVYSMSETANFQSNLDHRNMEMDALLRQVFRDVGATVNFVQLYSTTPHCHSSPALKHPVSRVISMCDLHIEKHRKMLASNASKYVAHMQDLAQKTVARVHLRLEAVFLVTPEFPKVISPSQFFVQSMVDYLLETVPMVVPFKDNENKLGLSSVIYPVTMYLTSTLLNLLESRKGMDGYHSSWTAFQFELALEEFFFGRPIYPSSRQYAAALGVCACNPNSVTRMRGFLGLAPVGSASVGESPPPLEMWLRDDVQISRVKRIFPLSDCLNGGHQVIGETLTRVLLCDLYGRNDRVSTEHLKGPERPYGNLVDCRTVSEFARELCERKAFGYPHTFGRAIAMVTSFGKDPAKCLEAALVKFKFFPHIRYWDEKRHCKAKWNKKDYLELHLPSQTPSAASLAASYRGDICAKIEEMDLAFSRNVNKYKEHGMPWLERCLECLPRGMPKERLLTALVFLSCVGIIQNGDFISFERLAVLERSLPVTQKHLQQLGVLSNLLLIHRPQVWRFHESVPYKVTVSAAPPAPRPHPRATPQVEEHRTEVMEEEIEEQPEEEVVQRIETGTVPASSNSRWSNLEVSYVDFNSQMSHSCAYEAYVKRCRENSTPVRTFYAFKTKRRRLILES